MSLLVTFFCTIYIKIYGQMSSKIEAIKIYEYIVVLSKFQYGGIGAIDAYILLGLCIKLGKEFFGNI